MRALYHVTRLPRPQRVRLRPAGMAVRCKPGYARAEADDSKLAHEQAALEAAAPPRPIHLLTPVRQASRLPSMFDARPSLLPPPEDGNAEPGPSRTTSVKGKEKASPSTRDSAYEPASAQTSAEPGPSRILSTKGKAKTLPSMHDSVYDPAQPAEPSVIEAHGSSSGPRRNAVGVQLLSPSLHKQLFPGPRLPAPPPALLEISRAHLKAHGLEPSAAGVLPEIAVDLPPLQGADIRAHFHALGAQTAEPYLSKAKAFAGSAIPPMPTEWIERPGWTRYPVDGPPTAVERVQEDVVVFDVETVYKVSPYSVMATAASTSAWYAWLDPAIFADPASGPHAPSTLIPLFPADAGGTLAIGHNVGYDRARVADEYALARPPTRWLDTLSLHVATRGITSVQRPTWVKHRKTQAESLAALHEIGAAGDDAALAAGLQDQADGDDAATWMDVTSTNSLAEVARLHTGKIVDKSVRDRFGDDALTGAEQLRCELQTLLTYCANDVQTTHDVFKAVLPLFLTSCPHPATFAGVLAMGSAFLPVDESWERYIAQAEAKYGELADGVRRGLRLLADKLRRRGHVEGDPWSEQLDWTPKVARWEDEEGNGAATPLSSTLRQAAPPPAPEAVPVATTVSPTPADSPAVPAWYAPLAASDASYLTTKAQRDLLPLLLRLSFRGHPVTQLSEHLWCFRVPATHSAIPDYIAAHGEPVEPSAKDRLGSGSDDDVFFKTGRLGEPRRGKLVGPGVKRDVRDGLLASPQAGVLGRMLETASIGGAVDALKQCAADMRARGADDPWGSQLDWAPAAVPAPPARSPLPPPAGPAAPARRMATWPKWYWDLSVPSSNKKVGPRELDLTVRKSVAPLLLRMQWRGYPLVLSREHKWVYRVPRAAVPPLPPKRLRGTRGKVDLDDAAPSAAPAPAPDPTAPGATVDTLLDPTKTVRFKHSGDAHLHADTAHAYFKVPHKDGDGARVGNPLSKGFLKALETGELSSAAAGGAHGTADDDEVVRAAKAATEMNALCSYWMSSRERIKDQMVVWEDKWAAGAAGPAATATGAPGPRLGLILPKVITMGTVTRRAVEATWLTASNAKKNRVGSELKAMVRAPPGYAIVGADVDSEELWISSVMGDSQFGMHGATAIGWMTLEGTKSAGTDLHSKTASILGISRDAAKVFNYSRIYGAGTKHAIQLLLQGDGSLGEADAAALAERLYTQTKGGKARRGGPRLAHAREHLWHGGSESYLFNTLEAIALLERPTTPALGCGVTRALRRRFLDDSAEYLPSRINWVVQSSGVDYLHLLICAMEHLIARYAIGARYLISVHDEVRYLATEADRHRTAFALQVANAWTRALFCFNLGIDDVPQGVAFFSAVDIDHVLRKETDMPCVTPSQPQPVAPGESLDMASLLAIVDTLGEPVGAAAPRDALPHGADGPPVVLFADTASPAHARFLRAQADVRGDQARAWLRSQRPAGWAAGDDDGGGAPLPAPRRRRMRRAAGADPAQVHALGVDVDIDMDSLGPDTAEPEVRARGDNGTLDVDWSEVDTDVVLRPADGAAGAGRAKAARKKRGRAADSA